LSDIHIKSLQRTSFISAARVSNTHCVFSACSAHTVLFAHQC